MGKLSALLSLSAFTPFALCNYEIVRTPSNGLRILDGNTTLVDNAAILAGGQNTTVSPIDNSTSSLAYNFITPSVAKITINSSYAFIGAKFSSASNAHFFGVWEYPFNNRIDNRNVSFDLKGVGNNVGINWANARAPFFMSSDGYGVYTDTLKMGSYDFATPNEAQFIFNSSSLVYYIILPKESQTLTQASTEGGLKSVIEQYTALSARSEMPPTSGFGPTYWSDDFTRDFHGDVSNAAENIQDVVNHLYYNRIRATSTFADRPYGTGNQSWGNFDFNPVQYPDPEGFIGNLTDYGFDFQVWIANRAQIGTKLYNDSLENGWLFPDFHPLGGLGEALDLNIPEAYRYFEEQLAYFPRIGVRGYKIDRGEEGEVPVYAQNEQMSLFTALAYQTMVSKFGKSGFYTFARSAVDRSRAHTHIWNGDSHADFTGLAYSVASGIRAGLISFGLWGSDTGGYTRAGELSPSPLTWGRWMWFSALSPVYELMLGTNHTPWYPPYDNTSTLDVMKQTANLHADLTPFIKSYAYQSSKTGLPIMRALFLEAPADTNSVVWESGDSYFFGEEFLVAPIVTEGNVRSVYFPTGPSAKYLEYFEKKTIYDAGTTANVTADLTSMPVFVKQGAIVPRGDIFQGNAKWIEDWTPKLRMELFPSYDVPVSTFKYYDGEGSEGTEYLITLTTDKAKQIIQLDLGGLKTEGLEIVWYLRSGSRIMTEKQALEQGLVVNGAETLF
ncbi:glycoside hydrolase family 31 protein [Periconia macrospinosa]|uniref:Glycoside hydrolase family 31 protein n=1 Tax=Periconia macrospinosa TaxID=97972 RepID=A0A2V1E331_9PLEO|nr:glycoside hydrolase family 31 protein [Periconia macrospinosa]